MRPTKLALSALAIAVALGGSAYAADTATPAQPAANSAVHQAAAPAKHRIFKKRAAKKAPAHAASSTSTSTSTSNTTTGAH